MQYNHPNLEHIAETQNANLSQIMQVKYCNH